MSKKKREQRRLLQLQRQAGVDAGAQSGNGVPASTDAATPHSTIVQPTPRVPESICSPQAGELLAVVREAASEATSTVSLDGLGSTPEPADNERLWRQLMLARQQFTEARDAAKLRIERAEQRERQAKDVLTREKEVIRRERELREREINAEQGFIAQNEAALAALDSELSARRNELADLRGALAMENVEARARRSAMEAEWQEQWARRRADFDAELAGPRLTLEHGQLALRERTAAAEVREQVLREREQLVDRLIAARTEERISGLRLELEGARAAAMDYHDRVLALETRLREQEQLDEKVKGQSPASMLHERDRLRARCHALEEELANRLPLEAGEELIRLQREHELWAKEQAELHATIRGLKDERLQLREQAWDAEQHRREVMLLEQQRRVLEERIVSLTKTIDDHLKSADGGTPFKGCSIMDTDLKLQREPQRQPMNQGLSRIVNYVRHRMAIPSGDFGSLFYTERDVRSFIGGMAMSRLIMLQGISGIGKTSLPRAVARVLGGEARVIPVQAGWRDRYDLLGHYNSFEGRYRESAFLQALYEAATPAYRDGVFFIVLDEVNLSRPEQYFADVLSALELGEHERYLELMDAPVPNPPKLLQDGRRLAIPRNVWFVGTANQDETTHQFADKTVDRSHVLELPSSPEHFKAKPEKALTKGVSVNRLLELFHGVETKYPREIDDVHALFFDVLREHLAHSFGIGLSGRLGSQLKRYVGVIVDAGGSATEAADHLLATRLLQKVRDRHDIRVPELQQFEAVLTEKWRMLDSEREPDMSLGLIRGEIRRLQTGMRTGG